MNNIWNELSEDSKKEVINEYALNKEGETTQVYAKFLEHVFGKENLNPEPPIKTWEDVAKLSPHLAKYIDDFDTMYLHGTYIGKVIKKVRATAKIAKLIELGYGGMVTDEEWLNDDILKHCIVCVGITLEKMGYYNGREFIAFHTEEQRDEFFKNNEQLCKDYYMIP